MDFKTFKSEFEDLLNEQKFEAAKDLLKEHTEEVPANERQAPFSSAARFKQSIRLDENEAEIALPFLNSLSNYRRNLIFNWKINSPNF